MTTEHHQPLPLDGIRVIEFSHMVMGPTCGLVLADLGAEIIKIEPAPDGDSTRRLLGSGAGFWVTYNRNKKSMAVDVKSAAGMKIVKKLITSADVLIENFRPGAMEKLDLAYHQVKQWHASLIYCSLKGFLPGPYENRTALDEVVQMMTGLAYMTGPEGRPLRAGASVNDIMGGMFGAIAILSALYERKNTGKGQLVQAALYENSAFLVAQHMMQYVVTGAPAAPMPNRLSAWGIYDVFDAKDGEQVFIGVVSDSQWKIFCDAFDLDDLANDISLATNNQRVNARVQLLPALQARLLQWSKQELMEKCERAGLPFAPIKRPQDLFEDPHLLESGGMADVSLPDGRQVQVPMLPFSMNGRRFGARLDAPASGSHSKELLSELGYTAAEVSQLEHAGVITST